MALEKSVGFDHCKKKKNQKKKSTSQNIYPDAKLIKTQETFRIRVRDPLAFGWWHLQLSAAQATEKSQSGRSIKQNLFLFKFYRGSCFLQMSCIGRQRPFLFYTFLSVKFLSLSLHSRHKSPYWFDSVFLILKYKQGLEKTQLSGDANVPLCSFSIFHPGWNAHVCYMSPIWVAGPISP